MSDLIKRSDAIEAIAYSQIHTLTREERICLVKEIPSAVRPSGKWIKDKWTNIWGKEIDCYRCSNCGIRGINHSLLLDITGYNYCPNCGEWMKGADDDSDNI